MKASNMLYPAEDLLEMEASPTHKDADSSGKLRNSGYSNENKFPREGNFTPDPQPVMASSFKSEDNASDQGEEEEEEDSRSEDQEEEVSESEIEDLEFTENSMPSTDESNLRQAALDNTDQEGTPLNEEGFKNDISGEDLDVPGSEQDDSDEEIGSEDEENNDYSLGGDDHDETSSDIF